LKNIFVGHSESAILRQEQAWIIEYMHLLLVIPKCFYSGSDAERHPDMFQVGILIAGFAKGAEQKRFSTTDLNNA